MTVYAWPTGDSAFLLEGITPGVLHNSRSNTSELNAATQGISLPGARWAWTIELPVQSYAERARVEAFFNRLNGVEHSIGLWDLARPVPRGTCNLSGVTLNAAAAQFAEQIVLTGCGVSTTLLAGDWVAVATGAVSQLVQAATNATASAGGVMTLPIRHQLRVAASSGAAVTLDRPTGLYKLKDPNGLRFPRAGSNRCPEMSIELVEVFA